MAKFIEPTEITATVTSVRSYPSKFSEDKHFTILHTREHGSIVGEAEPGGFLIGCSYRFSVVPQESEYGKQYKFRSYVIREPNTRAGVVSYLAKFCVGIGSIIAGRICDKFTPDLAISSLRDSPEKVASAVGLNIDRAIEAAEVLKQRANSEETYVALLNLLKNRRFRQSLPDLLIKKYGSAAEKTIRDNPFLLIEDRYPGCGFLLVNEFYLSLGHDPCAITRQVYALVYVLERLADGSTWGSYSGVYTECGKLIDSGLRFQDAIAEAVQKNKVKVRTENGEMWIACTENADQEVMIAERLIEIAGVQLIQARPVDSDLSPADSVNPLDDLFADEPVEPEESKSTPPTGIQIADVLQSSFDEILAKKTTVDVRDVKEPLPKLPAKQDDEFDFELEFSVPIPMKEQGRRESASGGPDDGSLAEARELIEKLDAMTEELTDASIPAADRFLEGIIGSLAGISENIEKRKFATERQLNAIESMTRSTEKWLERIEARNTSY